jgi:hypothetical protein
MFGTKPKTSTQTVARSVALVQDPSGRPAVDLTKVREGHVSLAKRADKAGVALNKRGLSGIRAEAALYLDHSGSMYGDYASGAVQALVERALGFTLQIDADGRIPVIAWDSKVWPETGVTVATYHDVVANEIWQRSRMGSTALHRALADLRDRAANTDSPIFAVIVTDGQPDDQRAATDLICDLARYPVFVKFLALRSVPYLDELDNLDPSRRLVDNVDTKAFPDLGSVTDMKFADDLADEWQSWVFAARQVGILV